MLLHVFHVLFRLIWEGALRPLVSLAMLLSAMYALVVLTVNSPLGWRLVQSGLSTAFHGEVRIRFVELSPWLDRVRVHGVRIHDTHDREVIALERLECTLALSALVRAELRAPACRGSEGRVLVLQDDDSLMSIERVFAGTWMGQRQSLVQPVFRFERVDLVDIDVLISVPELELYFERVRGEAISFVITPDSFDLYGPHTRWTQGYVRLSESLLNLGDGLPTWESVRFEIARARDPWATTERLPPAVPAGAWGWLQIPWRDGQIDDFHWKDYAFGFREARVRADGGDLEVSGALRLIPERPKVAPSERANVWFDGRVRYALRPDSRALAWLAPGIVSGQDIEAGAVPRFDPVELDAWGTVRFASGRARLGAHDLRILGWPLDAAHVAVTLEDGELTLEPESFLQMWGGRITAASGRFVPRRGVWSARVCMDGVDVFSFAAPLLLEGLPPRTQQPWIDARMSTTPRRCDWGADAGGLLLGGGLTLKGLGYDIAATTPEDKTVQPPMLAWGAQRLQWQWSRPPPGFPSRNLELDLHGRLDQRGRWHLTERTGEGVERAGVRVRRGPDSLAWRGVLQGATLGLRSGEVVATVADWSPWLGASDVVSTLGPWTIDARGVTGGTLEIPTLQRVRLVARPSEEARSGYLLPRDSRVEVAGDFDARGFRVREGAWTSSVGTTSATGRLDLLDGDLTRWRTQPTWALQGELRELDTAWWLGGPLTGGLDASWRVSGRRDGVHGDAEVRSEELAVVGEPLRSLNATFQFTPRTLTVSTATAALADGAVHVEGEVDLQERLLDLDVWTETLALEAFALIEALDFGLRGSLRSTARLDRTFDEPGLAFQLVVDDFGVGDVDLGVLSLVGRLFGDVADPSSAAVEMVGNVLSGTRIAVTFPLTGDQVIVEASLRQLDLAEAFADRLPGVRRAPLTAELRAVFDLDPQRPALALEVDLEAFELEIGETLLRLQQPTQVQWVATQAPNEETWAHDIRVEELLFGTREGSLRLAGSLVDLSALEASVEGVMPLSLLELVPELIVSAEGQARVNLEVGGTLVSPTLSGEVEVEPGGRVAPRGLGAALELDDARILVESERFVIDADRPLRGTLLGGAVTLSGEVGHRLLVPTSADVRTLITALTWRIPNELVITLTGNLRFVARDFEDATTWTIGGDIEILDARYYRNFDLFADQIAFGAIGRSVSSYSEPLWREVPTFGQMNANLRIVGRDRFFVESRVANAALNLELQPDLVLTGPFAAMVMTGEVTMLDTSRVTYRGRQFDVERGTLTFDGFRDEDGYPMPTLDTEMVASIRPCTRSSRDSLNAPSDGSLRLETRADLVRLTAFVEGRVPYDLTFTLESAPFYDQRDLLSLILTGCTLDELTAASGASPTLDILFRPVISAVERNVEERFDVDDVEIVPTAEGVVDIFVRDEVTERLSWTFNARVGAGADGGQQSLRAAYRVLDLLILEIREQSEGRGPVTLDAGVRLRFRLD